MISLADDYNKSLASQKEAAKLETEAQEAAAGGTFLHIPKGGVRWTLHETQYDGRPYAKVTCPGCKNITMTMDLDFVLKHCGQQDAIPADLRKRLEALLIKRGYHAQSFVERILGKSSPTPNLTSF